MRKLPMKSADGIQENVDRISAIIPNCVSEMRDKSGQICRKIDFDILRRELSDDVFEGGGRTL